MRVAAPCCSSISVTLRGLSAVLAPFEPCMTAVHAYPACNIHVSPLLSFAAAGPSLAAGVSADALPSNLLELLGAASPSSSSTPAQQAPVSSSWLGAQQPPMGAGPCDSADDAWG
jgi:hypothetical protein